MRRFPVAFGATPDVYGEIFKSVEQSKLEVVLKEMTGVVPVTVDGRSFLITDRYLPASKANYRAYLSQYYRSLGLQVNELAYATSHNIGETQGHNVEAVLPGKSRDSVVVIVHYDSIGPDSSPADNPGVDDDMTGMSISLETARVLSQFPGRLQYTIRFVAADYEEQASPGLEGARNYAGYISALAKKEGFQLIAAIDNEQSGWNCAKEGGCSDKSVGNIFDVFSCSTNQQFSYPAMGDLLAQVATQYSGFQVNRDCMGENSDHYAMWEIGVPAVVYSEHQPFLNPHFDAEGGDTYDKIDQDYFFRIAQVGVTFAAKVVGVSSSGF